MRSRFSLFKLFTLALSPIELLDEKRVPTRTHYLHDLYTTNKTTKSNLINLGRRQDIKFLSQFINVLLPTLFEVDQQSGLRAACISNGPVKVVAFEQFALFWIESNDFINPKNSKT